MNDDKFSQFSSYEEYRIGSFLFKVYLDKAVDKFCKEAQILNICITDSLGNRRYLKHISGIDNSPVTGIFDKGETIGLYHWRGFLTRLNKETLDFIDQSFTK